jgi:Flp pilus assembly protein TadG
MCSNDPGIRGDLKRSLPGVRRLLRSGGEAFRRGGAVTLEMALTLSILFSICYGLIEFGYYFYVKNTMEGAAREGCRAAIVTGATIASANTAIENQLQVANLVPAGTTASASGSSYTIGNYTVTYTDSTTSTTLSSLPGSMSIGDTLTVTITATWGTVGTGFRPEALIGSSKVLTTASAMRKEGL